VQCQIGYGWSEKPLLFYRSVNRKRAGKTVLCYLTLVIDTTLLKHIMDDKQTNLGCAHTCGLWIIRPALSGALPSLMRALCRCCTDCAVSVGLWLYCRGNETRDAISAIPGDVQAQWLTQYALKKSLAPKRKEFEIVKKNRNTRLFWTAIEILRLSLFFDPSVTSHKR
jgi:hypothetical protein